MENYFEYLENNGAKAELNMQEHLTDHFTVWEMLHSNTCDRIGMLNRLDEPEVIIPRLRTLCQQVLEPLRQQYGKIIVISGYRSDCLNYVVGGVPNSQHCLGEAADIYVSDYDELKQYAAFIQQNLTFDQLIMERNKKTGNYWLHVSYTKRHENRRQVLKLER